MAAPSITGLKEFIRSQPVSRVVRHDSWADCAVGDYAREVLGHTVPIPVDDDYSVLWKDPVIRVLYQESGTHELVYSLAYDIDQVSNCESIMDFLNTQAGVSTYGELHADLVYYGFM